jgi:hypothetical protein
MDLGVITSFKMMLGSTSESGISKFEMLKFCTSLKAIAGR